MAAKNSTFSLSDQSVADLRQIKSRVLGRGQGIGINPYQSGTERWPWLRITAHALEDDKWVYTVDVYTASLLAGTDARTATDQTAHNATATAPLPVGAWVRAEGIERVDDEWVFVFAQTIGVFRCAVTQDGGSAGSASTTCSFTYTLKSSDDVLIAEDVTPQRPRLANIEYATPAADSTGLAYYDAEGVHLIEAVEEIPLTEACPPPEEEE